MYNRLIFTIVSSIKLNPGLLIFGRHGNGKAVVMQQKKKKELEYFNSKQKQTFVNKH